MMDSQQCITGAQGRTQSIILPFLSSISHPHSIKHLENCNNAGSYQAKYGTAEGVVEFVRLAFVERM